MGYVEKASKSIPDADGFMTDYTMYRDTENGEYVFVFGDKEIYTPKNSYLDWSCETEKEAWEWFSGHNGFTEVDELDPSDYGYDDDSDRGCSDCPPDECTGHCMSCYYRPV